MDYKKEAKNSMTMRATILRAQDCDLLVRDHNTRQEVLVHTVEACGFRSGERICIEYDGIMTMSIPPQITATRICRISSCRR